VALVAEFIAGSRTVEAFVAWREWQKWKRVDPSGAALYRAACRLDAGVAIISLTVACLVWWLLVRDPEPDFRLL